MFTFKPRAEIGDDHVDQSRSSIRVVPIDDQLDEVAEKSSGMFRRRLHFRSGIRT